MNKGLTFTEKLHEGRRTLVYRAKTNDDRQIVVKILNNQYPKPEEIAKLRREFEITRSLHISGIIEAYALEPWQNTWMMILEDFGGESLTRLKQMGLLKLNIEKLLHLAVRLAEIIGSLHDKHLIHKDINPSNIVWNKKTDELKLIDFGISSVLSRETPAYSHPNAFQGTLAYISPEQTGRMNRSIDYRTDFYSLGVTLYELMTSYLPFPADDPIEIVHSHIACIAQPPDEKNPEIPSVLSNIIKKLMAKNAEDRYQSASGLARDLQACIGQLSTYGEIRSFEIGRSDFSHVFQIPQKLYGRKEQISILMKAFEKARQGASEMLLIAGYSGIGKTSLVQEVHKAISKLSFEKKQGYFVSGKFDQFKRNLPYAPFIEAFQQLIRYILTESKERIDAWRAAILKAVGLNGKIIIDVIPEVELIIGRQPDVPELPPTEGQNRFNYLMENFIRVFAGETHPLTIFIDDLQWIDSSSLKMIELFMSSDMTHLLLIGAYRNNEVDSAHPLMQMLDSLRTNGRVIDTIHLLALEENDITQLIADTMNCKPNEAKPLSAITLNKTSGNPFFINQFLPALYRNGLIDINSERLGWRWDIENIIRTDITDNVADLMTSKIKHLRSESQDALKIASAIGVRFSLKMLSMVMGKTYKDASTDLWEALQENLIAPRDERYSYADMEAFGASIEYQFVHDRIQQSAYSFIEETDKPALHLKIGRLMKEQLTIEEQHERIFDMVNHLNAGRILITDTSERKYLIDLNHRAGKKARQSMAYGPAKTWLSIGKTLLGHDGWHSDYHLTYELSRELAEASYLNGDFESSDILISEILTNAKDAMDKCHIYNLAVIQKTMYGNMASAIEAGMEAIKLLGIDITRFDAAERIKTSMAELEETIGKRVLSDLFHQPRMVDPLEQLTVKILSNMGPPTFLTDMGLYKMTVIEMVRLSVERGITRESSGAFGAFGLVLSEFGRYREALAFLNLGLRVSEEYHDLIQKCKNCDYLAGHINHWTTPLEANLAIVDEGFRAGVDSGELQWAGYNLMFKAVTVFYTCDSLITAVEKLTAILPFTIKTKNILASDCIKGALLSISRLREYTDLDAQEESHIASCRASKSAMELAFYFVRKTAELYYFDRIDEGLVWLNEARELLINIPATYPVAVFYCFESLIMIRAFENRKLNPASLEERLFHNQEQIDIWASQCPENFSWMKAIIGAEMARIKEKDWEASELYEQAIRTAKESRMIQNEALTNELTARFWLAKGRERIAEIYMREAHYAYQKWGAVRKAIDLEKTFGAMLSSPVDKTAAKKKSTTSSDTEIGTSGILDANSLIKAARALSAEIRLNDLIKKMLHFLLENAGAQTGIFILKKEDEFYIEAIGTADTSEIVVQTIPLDADSKKLPISVIRYVINTFKNLTLDNACISGDFIHDDYICKNQVKSVLASPIFHQNKLLGVIYLENNLTHGVFNTERLEIVEILAAQAAVSIENAVLYTTLEEKVEARTRELKTAQVHLVQSEKMAGLGTMVAGVAHEINNPVTFSYVGALNTEEQVAELKQFIFNLAGDDFSEKIRSAFEERFSRILKNLNAIVDGTQRIKSIVNDLRTFSRIDEEDRKQANIVSGLKSTLNLVQANYKDQVEFVTNFRIEPEIWCYPAQLNQVFMNIMMNACQAMVTNQTPDAILSRKLTITTLSRNEEIVICFEDTGSGIAKEIRSKIFDPFFTTKPVGIGVGLGLSISYEIVRKHGGRITVDSEVGKGSCFTVILPIAESEK